jgi:hypothetical protein
LQHIHSLSILYLSSFLLLVFPLLFYLLLLFSL